MAAQDPDFLHDVRARSATEGGVFWLDESRLMVADADAARRVHGDNFADLTIPDRFIDQLLRRRSTPVSWKQVRSLWLGQLHGLIEAEPVRALADRMDALLSARAGQRVNLVWLAHEVVFRSLVPLIIDGLSDAGQAWVARDAIAKLDRLINTASGMEQTRRQRWSAIAAQARVGLVVRREIRGRARGRRRPRVDLTQPIVDELLPALGSDRALHAITTVLTAIAGPPGAVASCMMFELVNRPDWAARLTSELTSLDPDDLYSSGGRCAPLTQRFVREVLRMWSAPTLMTRSVRTPVAFGAASLSVGQQYLVSPLMVHHDPRHWNDPDTFDPDRWLPGATNGPTGGQHSVPFGWQPTACIGAGVGIVQLVLLCHLFCTRFRIEPADRSSMRIVVAAVPIPLDFDGRITACQPAADSGAA